ncbi:AT-rich interactive domain-containing protein [Drosera capensis]
MKMDWWEVERVDDVSMEMSGNGTISSGSNGVDDKGFGDGKVVRSKSKGRKLEWREVERVNDVLLEMSGNGTIWSGSNRVDDVIKGSPNSASVKCCGEGEDEEICVQNSDMQVDSVGRKRKRDCLSKMLQWMGNAAKDPKKPGIRFCLRVISGNPMEMKSCGSRFCLPERRCLSKCLCRRMLNKLLGSPWRYLTNLTGTSLVHLVCFVSQFDLKKHRMHPSMYDDHSPPTDRLRSNSRLLFDMSEYSPHQSSSSTSQGDTDGSYRASSDVQLNQRALRCDISFMKSICPDHHIRKRIPVSPYFQADVRQWTEKSTYESDDKWLRTCIWPLEKRQNKLLIERDPIGKGRQDSCGCQDHGSITCVRLHIAEKRIKLKLELGSAFYHWNFD